MEKDLKSMIAEKQKEDRTNFIKELDELQQKYQIALIPEVLISGGEIKTNIKIVNV